MTHTVSGSSSDAGRTNTNSAHPDGRPAILRFVERFKRASGTSPSATPPATPQAAGSGLGRAIGDSLGRPELERLREARRRATEMYPGPVGELIVRDLEAVAEFGFRFARGTLYRRLLDHLLDPRTSANPAAEADHAAATRDSFPPSPAPSRRRLGYAARTDAAETESPVGPAVISVGARLGAEPLCLSPARRRMLSSGRRSDSVRCRRGCH